MARVTPSVPSSPPQAWGEEEGLALSHCFTAQYPAGPLNLPARILTPTGRPRMVPNGCTDSHFGQHYVRVPVLLHPCHFWYYRLLFFNSPNQMGTDFTNVKLPVSIGHLLSKHVKCYVPRAVLNTLQTPQTKPLPSRRRRQWTEVKGVTENVTSGGTGASGKNTAGEQCREPQSCCYRVWWHALPWSVLPRASVKTFNHGWGTGTGQSKAGQEHPHGQGRGARSTAPAGPGSSGAWAQSHTHL